MAKPGIPCHLEKGKMIDAQVGFVDTFNWMVDYINNLRGDGEGVEISNPTGSNPVVRLIESSEESEGSASVSVTAVDVESGSETTVSGIKSIKFESASGSHVTLNLTDDGEGNATLAIGVEYVD